MRHRRTNEIQTLPTSDSSFSIQLEPHSQRNESHPRSTFFSLCLALLLSLATLSFLQFGDFDYTLLFGAGNITGRKTDKNIVGKKKIKNKNGKRKNRIEIKASDESKLNNLSAETQGGIGEDKVEKVAQEGSEGNDDIHIVFSTDCSAFQHWQSYLLFYSAYRIKQPGKITRIASGCSDDGKKIEESWHDEHIKKMSKDYNIHFTPHFSTVKDEAGNAKGDYKFFNKPMGLLHWFEHGEGMGVDVNTGKMKNENTVVALLDPDMILLKHITRDFSNEKMVIRRSHDPERVRVEHGVPFAQMYGLGAQWRRFDLDTITSDASSHAKNVDHNEAMKHYPVGPPYLATVRDMYNIAKKWVEFVPKVHAEYPHLLAEMYAFCIAAAHLNLPHELVEHTMVSNVDIGGEGWPFVDKLSQRTRKKNVCETMTNGSIDYLHAPSSSIPLPTVIHFCQRYILGEWFFGKRKVPKNFFTCEHPLLEVPPLDLDNYDYKVPTGKHGIDLKEDVSRKRAIRDGFVICTVTRVMNEASLFFKSGCKKDGAMEVNVEKSLNMHRDLF